MLTGALTEACLHVAQHDDPVAARAEISALITGLLSGFRQQARATSTQQ